MSICMKMKWKNGIQAGKTTWNQTLLCPHLYRDLLPPQHPRSSCCPQQVGCVLSRQNAWLQQSTEDWSLCWADVKLLIRRSPSSCYCLHSPLCKFKKCITEWFSAWTVYMYINDCILYVLNLCSTKEFTNFNFVLQPSVEYKIIINKINKISILMNIFKINVQINYLVIWEALNLSSTYFQD